MSEIFSISTLPHILYNSSEADKTANFPDQTERWRVVLPLYYATGNKNEKQIKDNLKCRGTIYQNAGL